MQKQGGLDRQQRIRRKRQQIQPVLQQTVAKKVQELAAKHAGLLVTIGIFALLLVMIMICISSCGAMFSEGMSTTMAGSYMSVPAEIDAADLAFSELEMEVQKEINAIETDYPDYDEYRYNLDAIGHDPFARLVICRQFIRNLQRQRYRARWKACLMRCMS